MHQTSKGQYLRRPAPRLIPGHAVVLLDEESLREDDEALGPSWERAFSNRDREEVSAVHAR